MMTPLTVETLLTTLDALALQALNASTASTVWERDTLQELGRQVQRLVQAADTQINP